jgi:tRNA (guanine-N7-)-methyltransferase
MRLKYVDNARELIEAHPDLVIDKQDNEKLYYEDMFEKKDSPIHLEIGIGKGQFIHELAKNNPNINFIGIEKFDSVIVRALEKVIEEPLTNLKLIRVDAQAIPIILKDYTVERIYLNFVDPWPKERHAKRRLTHRGFLDIYKHLLVPNGEVHLKTDNEFLYNYSLEEMIYNDMEMLYHTEDLHNDNYEGNIMTEFEEKFAKRGMKIFKLTARFKETK